MDRLSADRTATTVVAPPRATGTRARFSALTVPERDAVEHFCAEMRPWALRQAKRSYRHLPPALREQAVDRAADDLRVNALPGSDRRALTTALADGLTEALRHVHVGWCLNESSALARRDHAEPGVAAPAEDGLAAFVDEGLGGLERAVLQLEIGAGRDSRTTRAALRLGPREYGRHREEGISKLRAAIGARVHGRVCEQHLTSVVGAATGDRRAAAALAGGPDRCRACSREAQGIRAVLNERLAIAPWPLVIKPAGLLAAKLGGVAALFGAKGAGAGAGVGAGSGASAAATVAAAAVLATGGVALVGGEAVAPLEATVSKRAPVARVAPPAAAPAEQTAFPAAFRAARRTLRATPTVRRGAVGTFAVRTRPQAPATGVAPTTPPATTVAAAPSATPVPDAVTQTTAAVDTTVGAVKDSVKQITQQLPPAVAQPVDSALDGVQQTVDGLGQTVDNLTGK